MQVILAVVGRMKKGPELELVSRYGGRLGKSGRAVGLTGFKTIEIVESRAGSTAVRKKEEAEALISKLPPDCAIFAFDERGVSPSSREYAKMIGARLDGGSQHLALVIGGPDGLDKSLRDAASKVVSFGTATFPHQLVRILVLEQTYRAVTILTNHPYHRD